MFFWEDRSKLQETEKMHTKKMQKISEVFLDFLNYVKQFKQIIVRLNILTRSLRDLL